MTWAAYLLLGYFGFLINSLGPLVPSLREGLDLTYAQASLHTSAFAAGLLVASVTADRLAARFGDRALLSVAPTFALSVLGTLIMGTLGSLTLVQVSAVLARRHGEGRGQAFAEANAASSLCGVLAPWRSAERWLPGSAGPPCCDSRRRPWGCSPWCLAGSRFRGKVVGEKESALPFPPATGATGVCCSSSWRWSSAWASGGGFPARRRGLHAGGGGYRCRCLRAGDAGRVGGGRRPRLTLARAPSRRPLSVDRPDRLPAVLAAGLRRHARAGPLRHRPGDANLYLYPALLSLAVGSAPGQEDTASARAALASGLAILLAPFTLGALADASSLFAAQIVIPALLVLAGVGLGWVEGCPKVREAHRPSPVWALLPPGRTHAPASPDSTLLFQYAIMGTWG